MLIGRLFACAFKRPAPSMKRAERLRTRPWGRVFVFVLDRRLAHPHFSRVLKNLFALVILTALPASALGASPERSVVQIMTFSQQPVWDAPWRFDSVRRSSGSGFVIKGKRIMTNAHVVSWAKQIIVHRYQDPRPFLAKVQLHRSRLRSRAA